MSISAIQAAIGEGINFIDTAPIYGEGLAEELVGRAIVGRRDQLCIATKVGMRWDIEEGNSLLREKNFTFIKISNHIEFVKRLNAL